ncbi:MAG: hypothetical protein KKA79_01670 [Nanoarchaeota archaeon]|nr:hypothetical protein [Nanoarchaeota archaeon]MCG2717955.1 hypothetical protein [Nanoarchaeota archaeon]
MKKKRNRLLYWSPRVLCIIFILFISMFALDVFEYPFPEVLVALFMHLIPSFILTAVTILAWKKEKIGGIIFIGLAVFSVFFFNTLENPESLLFITGPVLLVGILFLLNHYKK